MGEGSDMVRRTDELREALTIVWNYVYSSEWAVTAQGDAEKALRAAFAEIDKLDAHLLNGWVKVCIGFALGVLVCVVSWAIGGMHS
jgi:hypothetical protein